MIRGRYSPFSIASLNAKLRHNLLLDMPSATNTDHDGRYYTETEVDNTFLKLDASNDPVTEDLALNKNLSVVKTATINRLLAGGVTE